MRVGYSFWGFTSDYKLDERGLQISAPDGNATYSGALIYAMQQRGHKVFGMQEDRDWPAWKTMYSMAFESHARTQRSIAYENVFQTRGETFPELDLLLLEWRWPIPGRNCQLAPLDAQQSVLGTDMFPAYRFDPEAHQPDLFRQVQLLTHYKETKTKIVFWDLDHKIEKRDEQSWTPNMILETSSKPRELTMKRTIVQPPCLVSTITERPTIAQDPTLKLVYIGSRYERDDVIDEWIEPVSQLFPGDVHFYGNWLKTLDECQQKWPKISYHDRVMARDFAKIYSRACAVPLLAKKSYLETGFITPRLYEALVFGSIPVGLASMHGVEKYVMKENIAHDARHLADIALRLSKQSLKERDEMRRNNATILSHMDAARFVETLERI